MADAPAIMFVKPGAISAEDKAILRDVRVIVVETEDPSAVKLVQAGHDLPTSTMLAIAGKAISNNSHAAQAFGIAVAAALAALRGPT